MSFDNNVFLTDIEIAHTVTMIIESVLNNVSSNPLYMINIAKKLLDSTQFMVDSMKESYLQQLNDLETELS